MTLALLGAFAWVLGAVLADRNLRHLARAKLPEALLIFPIVAATRTAIEDGFALVLWVALVVWLGIGLCRRLEGAPARLMPGLWLVCGLFLVAGGFITAAGLTAAAFVVAVQTDE